MSAFTNATIRKTGFNIRAVCKGFTLVELIVVVTILSILSTVGFVSLQGYSDDARNSTKEYDLATIESAITHQVAMGIPMKTDRLKPVVFANVPMDTTSYVGRGFDGMLQEIARFPKDPSTGKPYVVGFLTNGPNGAPILGQVAARFDNHGGMGWIDVGAPAMRVRGNYVYSATNSKKQIANVSGVFGLIPRWEVEDPDAFESTPFYLSGTKMYGGGTFNPYLFAIDASPLKQIQGYSTGSTLFYESFENVDVSMQDYPRPNLPSGTGRGCVSRNAGTAITYEYNTSYVDGLPTADCSIDKAVGANSQSSLHLKWVRDSQWGDGQYAYLYLDPTKKYKMSMDVRGTLTVDSGSLNVTFHCFQVNSNGGLPSLGAKSFLMPISSSSFSRVSGYVNAPDPTGNGLSLSVTGATTPVSTCIFYRANAPKMGDELWFDNHIVEEIP